MENEKIKLYKILSALAFVLIIFIGANIVTEIKGYRFIGGGVPATNTISVTGTGEISAAPDIATVSFSVQEESKKVKDAQSAVNTKIKEILSKISALDIPEKDVKTENYSSYPKYEFQQVPQIACMGYSCPPMPPAKQIITGYEVTQSVTITVRNLDLVSPVIEALGTAGVTNMNGPSFAIDKQDDLRAKARKEAIDKAREKAEVLAHDLGVNLVRVVSFSEGQNYPMYARAMTSAKMDGGVAAPAPELPQGEQKITSDVTVTYEIQ